MKMIEEKRVICIVYDDVTNEQMTDEEKAERAKACREWMRMSDDVPKPTWHNEDILEFLKRKVYERNPIIASLYYKK
jgi:hypothetical protein